MSRRRLVRTVQVNVRIEEKLVLKLEACAKENHNSLSQEIRERLIDSFHVRKIIQWELISK